MSSRILLVLIEIQFNLLTAKMGFIGKGNVLSKGYVLPFIRSKSKYFCPLHFDIGVPKGKHSSQALGGQCFTHMEKRQE